MPPTLACFPYKVSSRTHGAGVGAGAGAGGCGVRNRRGTGFVFSSLRGSKRRATGGRKRKVSRGNVRPWGCHLLPQVQRAGACSSVFALTFLLKIT